MSDLWKRVELLWKNVWAQKSLSIYYLIFECICKKCSFMVKGGCVFVFNLQWGS